MRVVYQRRHVTRPEDYESAELLSRVEVDTESETDKRYRDMTFKEIGDDLSQAVDDLLDTDVDRVLRLDGQHVQDSHLWVFYEKE